MSEIPLSPFTGIDATSLLQRTTNFARPAATSAASIHGAAVQFESVLLGQWLESAEKSFATVPGSEDIDDSGSEQMMSFGMQQFATAIAKSGGLGIARLVERGLATSAAVSTSGITSSPPGTASAPAALEPSLKDAADKTSYPNAFQRY